MAARTFDDEIDAALVDVDAGVKAAVVTLFKDFRTNVQTHMTTLSLPANVQQALESKIVDVARWCGQEMK